MDPFVAEIRIFPFNFAPKGWAFCSGQILPLSQNTALFSLLGTTYGGNGQTTFALPNLQGAAPMHPGQGPGLSLYALGQTAGSPTVTLSVLAMPAHVPQLMCSNSDGTDQSPANSLVAGGVGGISMYGPQPPAQQLSPGAVSVLGGDQPHNNMMPYLTYNFCIALQGVYPPRT